MGPAKVRRWLVGAVLLGLSGWLPGWAQPAPVGELQEISAKAGHGDLEAQNALGNIYTNGLLGVKQDFAEALLWYRRAAEKGHAPAQYNLGLAHELGRGVPPDERQAFKHYLSAAEQGFAAAQFNVGNMYAAGRGVGQDLFEANLWYKQAAEKGIREAQFNLGLAYEAGRGVKQDEMQAARWYQQAADRGYARAQYNLGLLHEDGRGAPKDEAMAASLYRAAAGQGLAAAQSKYGLMLSEGRGGLTKDPGQAFVWLSLAVANGADPAARDLVAKSLSAAQLAAANNLLSEHKSGQPLAVAPTSPPATATTAALDKVRLEQELARQRAAPTGTPAMAAPAAAPDAGKYPVQGSDKDSIIANLQRDNARLNDEVKRSTRELLLLNQQMRTQRNQPAKPATPGSSDNTASAELRTENQRVDTNNTRLQGQRDAAVSDAENLGGQLREARNEIARLHEQIQQLRSTRQSSDAASDQLGQLTSKIAQAEEEASRLQAENRRLAARVAELEK